jgi:deoxycytidylate deaminase
MPTTMSDIEKWIEAVDDTGSHVLIVCDTFDNSDYPVAVRKDENVQDFISLYNSKNMQRVLEVYNLGLDVEDQIASLAKVWNDQPYVAPIEEHKRSSWHLTWMSIALQYANHRSIDPATRHGCIFVSEDNQPLSMGFNSFPADCEDDKLPLTRPEKYEVIVHSEINAIINSNSKRDLKGCTAYITGMPCPRCFGSMINAKVGKIVVGPIGSHQLRESDMELIKQMNISAKTKKNKIEIVRYEDIEDLDDLIGSYDATKDYTESKMEQVALING